MNHCWLGGYQDQAIEKSTGDPSSGWKWITGETWKYTNWADGQPDNNYNVEEHLQFAESKYPGKWNDNSGADTTWSFGFVVEWDEYPLDQPPVTPTPTVKATPSITPTPTITPTPNQVSGFSLGGNELGISPGKDTILPVSVSQLPESSSITFDLIYDPQILTWKKSVDKSEH